MIYFISKLPFFFKANSVIVEEVTVPAWLHRFIIGRQGASVKKITQNTPKVRVKIETKFFFFFSSKMNVRRNLTCNFFFVFEDILGSEVIN